MAPEIEQDELPAWSEPFAPGSVARQERIPGVIGTIDRDWAWGGATGRG